MPMESLARLIIVLVIMTMLASVDLAFLSRRKPELKWAAIGGMLGAMLMLLGLLIVWFFGEW